LRRPEPLIRAAAGSPAPEATLDVLLATGLGVSDRIGDTTVLGLVAEAEVEPEFVRYLLAKGAQVGAPDALGRTPLHHAAGVRRRAASITALVAVGAIAGITALIQPGAGQALFPQLDLVASYRLNDRFTTYFGSQSMYQFQSKPNVVLAPFVGTEWHISDPFSLNLEAKWYAPTERTHPRNVNYSLPIGNHGAVGFVLGANYGFGGKSE
jgi:hypothetical protein